MFAFTAAEALVCDLGAKTFTMCDNFGGVWNITLDKGEIRGTRDVADPGVNCGLLPVYGTICCPQNKIRLTVLDTPEDCCISTFWEGQFTSPELDIIEGVVINEKGDVFEFTLFNCDSTPEQISAPDPALP
ncbi:MAG: hypothetical protein C4520_07050 [Candidatus Abyssobacteria bacterium SURF_5]|uniref:Uncharacterized protein n=1 Tax=Abyssobacteria bacterium (strain SURF_5) TaxID=2093360 RepID=A0A3A4NRB2_ABYX5|nr:MAG: hypothetical protein C4520_07050 [Candidatus Abyssubacteria bacterium SURF_5]